MDDETKSVVFTGLKLFPLISFREWVGDGKSDLRRRIAAICLDNLQIDLRKVAMFVLGEVHESHASREDVIREVVKHLDGGNVAVVSCMYDFLHEEGVI